MGDNTGGRSVMQLLIMFQGTGAGTVDHMYTQFLPVPNLSNVTTAQFSSACTLNTASLRYISIISSHPLLVLPSNVFLN